jgi:hypothetical protein
MREEKSMLRAVAALAAGLSVLAGSAYHAAASAQEAQVVRLGENFDVVWTGGGPRDNLVGGGAVRRDGGGDDAVATPVGPSVFEERAFATLSGGGDDMTLLRQAVPSAGAGGPMLAGRADRGAAQAAAAMRTTAR